MTGAGYWPPDRKSIDFGQSEENRDERYVGRSKLRSRRSGEIWGDLGTDSEFELQNSESVPRSLSPDLSEISAEAGTEFVGVISADLDFTAVTQLRHILAAGQGMDFSHQ